MRKRLAAIVVMTFIVAASSVYANGQAESTASTPQTITVWHWYDGIDLKAYQAVVNAFEAQNPNIKVQSTYFAYSEFSQKLLLGLAAGTLPDVALIDSNLVPTLGSSDKAIKINEAFPALFAKVKQDVLPGPVQMGSTGGNLVAVPYLTATMGMIYNKKLFTAAGLSQPPATWDQWASMSKKLMVYGPDGKVKQWGTLFWGHPYSTYASYMFEYHFLYANGQPSYTFNQKGTPVPQFDSPISKQSLNFINDLINKDKVVKVGGNMKDDFMAGKGVLTLGEATFVNQFLARVPDLSIGTTHDPSINGEAHSMVTGHLAMMFKSEKAKEDAAARFVGFFTLDPRQNGHFLATSGNFAASKLTMNDSAYVDWLKKNPSLRTFSDLVASAIPYVTIQGQDEINNKLTALIQAVVLKKETPDKALAEGQKDAEQIIANYYSKK